MLNEINGLPVHILIVHAVVVLVPLAALLAVLGVLWPAARRKLGVLTPIVALAGLVCVPVASSAGEWLQARVPDTALVRTHAEMGDGLLLWAFLLFVLSAAFWALDHGRTEPRRLPDALTARWVRPVVAGLLIVVAIVSVVQVVRIGDSGAKAAWDGRVASTPSGPGD